MTLDLHEAELEYPVENMIVVHENRINAFSNRHEQWVKRPIYSCWFAD